MFAMNCQDCQNELLQHPTLSADAQAHLDGCTECRAFAQTLAMAVPATPAPELDDAVRSACAGVLAARRQLRARRQTRRRVLMGLAAAVAVVLSVALLHTEPTAAPKPPVPTLASAAAQGEYTEALSWDVGVSLSTAELDQVELDLELMTAGL